ncbi:MAG: hypothetical protein CMD32_00265 [Flavobacteriales bacterium]|jgi:hypothetical protein|nr:hypothetical protein [Flavobacteriales bacterium]|tara:strand:+ start:152 stop:784 length:633 start_codon:yes stop_codon:yes gene_type:complete
MDMTTLQQNLVNAKKVMNKVDGGNFPKNEMPMTGNQPNINMESVQQHLPPTPLTSIPSAELPTSKPSLTPKANITENQIKNSKLPDVVKQAMINNPIPDIPFNGGGAGLSEDFLNGVKTQMNKQGISTNQSSPQQQILREVNNTKPNTKKLSSKNLKSIIKESVKELLDEVVTTRINESIGLRTDMGENFQFRVGDKVFYGKITSTKTVK